MRYRTDTLHVTYETKLSLPVEVEIETADSLMVDGQRVYTVGFVSNKTLIRRDTGCVLEMLRYRFHAGRETATCEPLSPWECRDEFMREDAVLRQCNAGLSAKKTRGKTGMTAIRPADNPVHSWALGLHGVAGSYVLTRAANSQNRDDRLLSPVEMSLDQECSGWRALIRDARIRDYNEWQQLEKIHPAEWVRELFTPLPLTLESREGAAIARVVCQSLLDVLIATTQLDGIRGLRQRICKADGCGKFFPTGNYEHKVYCDNECAHRQAVRDSRSRKRKAIEKASRKAN